MAQTILLKRSAVQGNIPTTATLALGELGMNTYDGKLFMRKDNGTPSILDLTAASNISFVAAGNIASVTVQAAIQELDTEKQPLLVSGTNIRTINGNSLLGSTDLVIGGTVTLTDDTSTNATYYPVIATAATGAMTGKASSSKLSFNPSTGTLSATKFSGDASLLSAATVANGGIVSTASQTFQGIKTFQAPITLVVPSTAQDGIILSVPATGSGSFRTTLGTNALSANRTINLPDNDGTLALESSIGTTITAAATINIGAAGTKSIMYLTGATIISSFGVSTTGTRRTLICSSDVNIVSNTTSLKTPGPSDITGTSNGTILECLCIDGVNGYWQILSVTVPTQGFIQMKSLLTLQNIGAGLLATGGAGGYRSAQSGTDIKTIDGVSLLGSGDISTEDTIQTPIASASTITIGTAGAGETVHITGTTTITSLGVASRNGVTRTLIFDGVLTLTHNATSLIMPGGVNKTTAAGDTAVFICENATSGYWRCVDYSPYTVTAGGSSVPVGGGTDKVFYENDNTMNSSYTITAGKNAVLCGPITISATSVLTIPSNSVVTIV